MAKLAFVLVLTDGALRHLGPPFAPLVPFAWHGLASAWLGPLLKILFLGGGVCLLFNRFVRPASAIAGLLALYTQAASAPAYGSHVVVAGLLLVLCPLHSDREQPWLVRTLVVAVLTVSALLKGIDPRWVTGETLRGWLEAGLVHPFFGWLHAKTSGPWLPATLAVLMVASEASIAVLLSFGRTRRVAVWSLAFYLLLVGLVLASPEVGALSVAVGLAAISFLDWPAGPVAVLWPRACGYPLWLRIALDRCDWDGRLEWPLPPDPDGALQVEINGERSADQRALSALLLHFPAFLALAFVLVWTATLLLPALVGPAVHATLVGPILAVFALRRIRRAGRRIQRAITTVAG